MRGTRHRRSRTIGTIASVVLGVAAVAVSTVPPASASSGAGRAHSCEVRDDGTLWCWGKGGNGELGQGDPGGSDDEDRPEPGRIGSLTTWAHVATGANHNCAVRTDGSLWCWGRNDHGELGLGDRENRYEPARVGSLTTWRKVAANGGYHTCGLQTDGSLWCWGYSEHGQMGNGGDGTAPPPDRTPEPVRAGGSTSTWIDVEAGVRHTCAIKSDRSLWCWGHNHAGQLGIGEQGTDRTSPVRVGTGTWTRVSTGENITCGIRTDGTLWCWGSVLGTRFDSSRNEGMPVPVQESTASATWSDVGVGWEHVCATRTDGTLWCWGHNAEGQLATGDTKVRWAPAQESSGGTSWTAVSCGEEHTLATRADGTLWGWGHNRLGQLGNGTFTDQETPVRSLFTFR